MGFLNKLNQMKSEASEKKVDLLSKSALFKPKTTTVTTETTSQKKILPFAKKAEPVEVAIDTVVEKKPEEEVVQAVEAPEKNITESTEALTTEETLEEPSQAEITEEIIAAVAEEEVKSEEEQEPVEVTFVEEPAPVEIEKKKRGRKPRAATEKQEPASLSVTKSNTSEQSATATLTDEAAQETATLVYTDQIFIPRTQCSLEEALAQIVPSFDREDFETDKAEIEEELAKIEIAADMNPGTMKVRIAELSILRDRILSNYLNTKSTYENLTRREPEGTIEMVKRKYAIGANDAERKRNGLLAAMSFNDNVNLLEVANEFNIRYCFYKGMMDAIQYKTNVLITMSSALKMENAHVMMGDN